MEPAHALGGWVNRLWADAGHLNRHAFQLDLWRQWLTLVAVCSRDARSKGETNLDYSGSGSWPV